MATHRRALAAVAARANNLWLRAPQAFVQPPADHSAARLPDDVRDNPHIGVAREPPPVARWGLAKPFPAHTMSVWNLLPKKGKHNG